MEECNVGRENKITECPKGNDSEFADIGSDTRAVIAYNLQALLEMRHKSRKEVCAEIGIKYTTFCEWINGNAYPRIEALEKLASYFEVQVGDFFVVERNADENGGKRIMAYASHLEELDTSILEHLTDAQIKGLLRAGVHFKHPSLEDYIRQSGTGKVVAANECDWGDRVGDEIW